VHNCLDQKERPYQAYSVGYTIREIFSRYYTEIKNDVERYTTKIDDYYKKPEITGIRANKRELILSVDAAGCKTGGDLEAILNAKLGL